jgi:hypothetical protein
MGEALSATGSVLHKEAENFDPICGESQKDRTPFQVDEDQENPGYWRVLVAYF